MTENSSTTAGATNSYTVVARRYRPQTFADLIGQEHVAKALAGAIETERIGHAFLFTGARGVGKTSAARILAKCLNCTGGPSVTPPDNCPICESIASGEDVDVLEIDGASNRGIDEIRQLRSNANLRPSRARFKIYIIDEVHMLTREAFNALLKTLEEPPQHVKFIFCTTEPNKIPITVTSRCQRFDFAGIQVADIERRLSQIVEIEGRSAETEALAIIARRAAGSMRDSQSLLEQLLAVGGETISAGDVHELLGTTGSERLQALAAHLVQGNGGGALGELDRAISQGADVGQLLDQLAGLFRDCMAALVGCEGDAFLNAATQAEVEATCQIASRVNLERVLAILQVLQEVMERLRFTTHRRTAAEIALVRIASLDQLDELTELLAQLRQGGAGENTAAAGGRAKKKPEPANPVQESITSAPSKISRETVSAVEGTVPPRASLLSLSESTAREIWEQALASLTGVVTTKARQYSAIAAVAPDRMEVQFTRRYDLCKEFCERPDQINRLQQAIEQVTGSRVQVVFSTVDDAEGEGPPPAQPSKQQRRKQVMEHPWVQQAVALLGARVVEVD